MNTKGFMTVAAFGGLLLAAGCMKKDTAATDSAGTAAMADTSAGGAAATGTYGTTPAPTMSDTAATGNMGTATGTDTTKGRTTGDTTTRK